MTQRWWQSLACVGVIACGTACETSVEDIQSRIDCASYCEHVAGCDEDVDESECRDECIEQLDNCMGDEIDEVQAQLDECSEKACEEIAACTINAGVQCYLGI